MKKLITLLTALLLALASTLHHYHIQWHKSRQKQGGDVLALEGAVAVWHTSDPVKQWNSFRRTALGTTLCKLPDFVAVADRIKRLASLLGADALPSKEAVFTVSVCEVLQNPGHVGWMCSIEASEKVLKDLYQNAPTNVSYLPNYTLSQEAYGQNTLITLTEERPTNPCTLYILCEKGRCTVSTRKRLLQQALQHGWVSVGRQRRTHLDHPHDSSYVYIDFEQCSILLNSSPYLNKKSAFFEHLCRKIHRAKLHAYFTDHFLLGYGTSPNACASLDNASSQDADRMGHMALMDCAVQDAVWIQHFSFDKAERFLQSASSTVDRLNKSQKHLLQKLMGHEILFTKLLSKTLPPSYLCCIQTPNPQAFLQALGVEPNLMKTSPKSNPYPPTVHRLASSPEAALQWTSTFLPGFQAQYATCLEHCVVVADQEEVLNTWQRQMHAQKRWFTSSPLHKTLLKSALPNAPCSFFVEVSYVCNTLADWVGPSWKELLTQVEKSLSDTAILGLQLMPTQRKTTLVNLMLSGGAFPQNTKVSSEVAKKSVPINATASPTPLEQGKIFSRTRAHCNAPPWPVKTHRSQLPHLFLQDKDHCLYFLDAQGTCLWQKNMSGPLLGKPLVMDFYNNGKLQYGLIDQQQLHLVDYYGRNVASYPQLLPPSTTHLGLIDYRKDKQYRLILSTSSGHVYLQDQHGEKLTGWNPKVCEKDFKTPIFHLYTGSKDYLVGLQTDGTLQLFNRRGTSLLNATATLPYTTVGYDDTTSPHTLVLLSEDGSCTHLDFEGRTRMQVNLLEQQAAQRVTLCVDPSQDHRCVIACQTDQMIKILAPTGDLLFELPWQAKRTHISYYYHVDLAKRVYVLTDQDCGQAYVCYGKGHLLHDKPLATAHPPAVYRLIDKDGKVSLMVYTTAQDKCMQQVFKL